MVDAGQVTTLSAAQMRARFASYVVASTREPPKE
jgi:hypothetical protein